MHRRGTLLLLQIPFWKCHLRSIAIMKALIDRLLAMQHFVEDSLAATSNTDIEALLNRIVRVSRPRSY